MQHTHSAKIGTVNQYNIEKSKSAYIKDKNVIYRKTSGAGYDNYTKYGYEMHKIYPSVMDFPAQLKARPP